MEIRIESLVEGAARASGVVAIIDVFRAFTTAAVAFASGAAHITMVASVEEALALRDRGAGQICMGAVQGRAPERLSLSNRLAASGLSPGQSAALTGAVQCDREALGGLLLALQTAAEAPPNPWEQALWMLLADFLAAAVPILPFVLLPVPQAKAVSAVVTTILLVALGVGRAQIAKRGVVRTVVETVSVGIAAALAGVAIGVLVNHSFSG